MKNAGDLDPRVREYYFDLPERLIASRPPENRHDSRLMRIAPDASGRLVREHRRFAELPELLGPGDLLVVNDARVSQRRLRLKRSTGAQIEALFLHPLPDGAWACLVRGKKRLKPGELVPGPEGGPPLAFRFEGDLDGDERGGNARLRPVRPDGSSDVWPDLEAAEDFFEKAGETPLPPYLNRSPDPLDRDRYQTVYAARPGSVAAPTAGLHFSREVLNALDARGVRRIAVSLEIGYGTFAPLTARNMDEGRLHRERYRISGDVAAALNNADARIIAVGTTALRALEANFRSFGRFEPGEFQTDIFLRPPERIQSVQGLLTNFHLPASSLMMLVACLIDREDLLAAYREAVAENYRFFSYGDAMLLLPPFST